jgi:hypothetical protein
VAAAEALRASRGDARAIDDLPLVLLHQVMVDVQRRRAKASAPALARALALRRERLAADRSRGACWRPRYCSSSTCRRACGSARPSPARSCAT